MLFSIDMSAASDSFLDFKMVRAERFSMELAPTYLCPRRAFMFVDISYGLIWREMGSQGLLAQEMVRINGYSSGFQHVTKWAA